MRWLEMKSDTVRYHRVQARYSKPVLDSHTLSVYFVEVSIRLFP